MIACVVKSKEASCSFSVVNIDNNWRKGNGWMYLMGERQKENKRDGVMRPRTKWKTYKRRQNNCRKRHMDSYFKHLFLQDNLLCFADSCVRVCVCVSVPQYGRRAGFLQIISLPTRHQSLLWHTWLHSFTDLSQISSCSPNHLKLGEETIPQYSRLDRQWHQSLSRENLVTF